MKKHFILLIAISFMIQPFVLLAKEDTAFQEDFTNNSHEWDESENSHIVMKITDGKYHFKNKDASSCWYSSVSHSKFEQNFNFEIETSIKKLSGKGNYGILWGARKKNFDSQHMLRLFSDDRQWRYQQRINGTGYDILVMKEKQAKGSPKILTIKKRENELSFWINGKQLSRSTRFEPFWGDNIGFFVCGEVALEIDYLTIRQAVTDQIAANPAAPSPMPSPKSSPTQPPKPTPTSTPQPSPTPAKYDIIISSSPSGANLFIDEKYRGKTPLNLSLLKEKNYSLNVFKEGFEQYHSTLTADLSLKPNKHITLVALATATPEPAAVPFPTETPVALIKRENPSTSNDRDVSIVQDDWTEKSSELSFSSKDIYAVIIGIEKYQDPHIPKLEYAVDDANGLYDVLIDEKYGHVPEKQIQLLRNEKATEEAIETAIGKWLKDQAWGEGDVVIIYFAGHGATDEDDVSYWLPYDAKRDNLYATALSSSRVVNMLNRIQSRRMVTFLDCCYSAATVEQADKTRSFDLEQPDLSGEGRVVISSSKGQEKSLELNEYSHGIFTYYLLEGLKGAADRNKDGFIEVEEIWNHIKNQVKEKAKQKHREQTPVLHGSLTSGIPLIPNMETISGIAKRYQSHEEKLADAYNRRLINREQFSCARQLLRQKAETSDRFLEDYLNTVPTAANFKNIAEDFGKYFKCP